MTGTRGLHALARLHGVQTAYRNNDGRRVSASPDSLLAALRALRVEVDGPGDIPARLEHRRRTLWERGVEPVVVAWIRPGATTTGADARFALRTQRRLSDAPIRVAVRLEEGGHATGDVDVGSLEVERSGVVAGTAYVERQLPIPPVPAGYHELEVEVGAGRGSRRVAALLIAAPVRACGWDRLPGRAGRGWGVFAPLHALWRERNGGMAAPTYPLLGELADRVADAGGDAIGTLPLLAAFLDRPYEPSPYAPVSRLFWNELYVEPVHRERGLDTGGEEAPGRHFDPRQAMASRRPLLEEEARAFFQAGDDGSGPSSLEGPPELGAFRARNPHADDYARFRALVEDRGVWQGWPDRLRARDVRPGDYDEEAAAYHLYVQWRAEQQLADVAAQAGSRGVSLYLDLPLGVHGSGYDVWRFRSLFAAEARAGAPPDPLGPGGQDWGFAPVHPEASREDGHRYFIASVRKHLRFARILRVDHVMQLERMYWVVTGDARDGVYVRYPAEELYAVLCLESHRAGAVIVGEDLGTVPRSVREGMRRHGLPGMYVLEFELTDIEREGEPALVPRGVPDGALASINTHDTPTFAGWWWGRDIEIRRDLGQHDADDAEAQLWGRGIMREKLARGLGEAGGGPGGGTGEGPDPEAHAGADTASWVQEALLRRMGRSGAGLVLATMEDFWLEREPQNVPGTMGDWNWRRRSARPLEALAEAPAARLMRALDEAREGNE
jgi:4-alpha-glucanotransferase